MSVAAVHRPRVLVVDDEEGLRRLLRQALAHEGFEVVEAADGLACLRALAEHRADAVVLDVGLPVLDGLEACRRIRAGGDLVPILMLTARDAVEDRVAGLEAGADDYLSKPFALRELVARLRSITRRAGTDGRAAPCDEVVVGDLRIDRRGHRAWRGDRELALTRTELLLLDVLASHAEAVVGRRQVMLRVWGYDPGPASNALGVYIGYLRRKLEASGEPRLIHTVRGVGYVLRAAS